MQVVNWLNKQAGKIADNFTNYKFYVKSTPEQIDSSTRLFLHVYSSRQEEAHVPCVFRWFRIRNGITTEALEFKGNTFICQPADVGAYLQAQITSIDQQYPGTALLRYGPVEIDVLLRQTIESALSTGQAKFQVDVGHESSTRQCTLQISDEHIRLAHCNSSAHFRFYYCLGEPLINTLPKDLTNIMIVFPQKYEAQTIKFLTQLWSDFALTRQQKTKNELIVTIRFINRRTKDEFLFAMKGFIAKRELKTSSVIKKIEKLDVDSSNINYMMEIESLRKDLLRMSNLIGRSQEEKKVYMNETLKLEKEIEDIISSYTKLIEGKFKTKEEFEESFIEFENKKDNAINNKYRKIEEENARLKEYIREKLDGEPKDSYINQLKQYEGREVFKKKEPFAEIEIKKNEYENILANLSGEEEYEREGKDNEREYQKLVSDKQRLESKLSKSLLKIDKLEEELDRVNRSAVVAADNNLSFSRRSEALDISTSKVVEEKTVLDRKYAKLKQQYSKLKQAYEGLKKSSVSSAQGDSSTDPEFDRQSSNKEILRLRSALSSMEREKDSWKEQAQALAGQLRRQKEQAERSEGRYQKKIRELALQLDSAQKNTDVLNRSQHLSMQMDEYNTQQNEILKEQNTFLLNQNQRLTKMCEKYKSQYKKMKESLKQNSESLLV